MNPNPADNLIPDPIPEPDHTDRRTASWDLKNAVRNYSTLVVTQIVIAFFSFASVWIATKYLGTDGYGGIVAIIAASQVAQIFVNWTCVGLARFGVEEFVKSGEISNSFWARTLIFLPNTIVFFVFSFLWFPVISGWLKLPPETYWYVVLHFVVFAVWLHVQHALQGAKLPRLQGVLLAAERILVFLILLYLATTGRLTYLWAIAAYVVAPLVMSIAGLVKLRKFLSFRIEFDWSWFRKLLKFSIPLIPFSLIGYFSSSYLDAIFISQFLSKSELGVYSIAFQLNGILMQFPFLAGSLLLPLFVTLQSKEKTEKINTYMNEVLPFLTFFGGLAGVVAAFLMQFFVPLVFGDELKQAVVIFWIFISSAAFAVPGLLGYVPYFHSNSATYVATINAIVASVVNIAANYILIPQYGLKGCAWATVLAYGTSFVVTSIVLKIQFKLNFTWILPAIIPVLAGSAYASSTDSYGIAAIVSFAGALLIVVIFRRSVSKSVSELMKFRTMLKSY